jgi:hypothetical protein
VSLPVDVTHAIELGGGNVRHPGEAASNGPSAAERKTELDAVAEAFENMLFKGL